MSKGKTGTAAPAKGVGHDDYQAEQDLRTLIEHTKIHGDPVRKKAAMKKHAELLANMQAVAAQAQMQPPATQPQPGGVPGMPVPGANTGAQ